jgi:arabinogalactan oligomer/maltooligosaccharide transport system substrate-binding protein
MKRLFLILLAVLLPLGACTGIEAEPSPDVSVDPDEPVLTKQEIELTVWINPGGEEFIERAAVVFNEKYPNITIRCESVEPAALLPRVREESESGGCADLFLIPHTEVHQLAEAEFILPARDQTETRDALQPACAQAATVKGVLYGYPVSAETTALFYNKRLISEGDLPGDWEELIAFANSYESDIGYGFIMPSDSPHTAASFLMAGGNRPFGPNGDIPMALGLNTPSAIEGMTVFRRLRVGGLSSEEATPDAVENAFASGRAALCMTGTWSVARFVEAGIDFDVVPLPAFPEDEQTRALAFARVMTVSAYSRWADEASAFAALLITDEMQRLRTGLTGELPSVILTMAPPYYGFIRQLANAVAAPGIPQAAAYWEEFGRAAARIWDGADIQETLDAADAAVRGTPAPPVDSGDLEE